MKKTLSTLVLSTLFSLPLYAVTDGTDGTAVTWKDYPNIAQNDCTSTVIAGKYLLTAAHCGYPWTVRFANGDYINPINQAVHPEAETSGAQVDVSLWTLPGRRENGSIYFFSDLTQRTVNDDDTLTFFGFGAETSFNTDLTYAVTSAELSNDSTNTSEQVIIGNDIGQGYGVGGDSGGPWLNTDNEIVAISKSISAETHLTYGTDLFFANEWILETIDGWHYPTQVSSGNSQITITVQSLHQNPTMDNAHTSGDATIIGGTCLEGEIGPFEKCTYMIENQGSEGKLTLDKDEEFITINKQSASEGDNGGALGLWGLLALAGLGFGRRKAA